MGPGRDPAWDQMSNVLPCILKLKKMSCPRIFVRTQAFRLMVGQGHCPMISKYDPSLSEAVGPVDASFLVVKNLTLIKKYSSYSESTNSTKQKVHVGSQYSKTCLK